MNSSDKDKLRSILSSLPFLDVIPLLEKYWPHSRYPLPHKLTPSIDSFLTDPTVWPQNKINLLKSKYLNYYIDIVFSGSHFGASHLAVLETAAFHHRVLSPPPIHKKTKKTNKSPVWNAFVNQDKSPFIDSLQPIVDSIGSNLSTLSHYYFISASKFNSQIWLRIAFYQSPHFFTGPIPIPTPTHATLESNSTSFSNSNLWPFTFQSCDSSSSIPEEVASKRLFFKNSQAKSVRNKRARKISNSRENSTFECAVETKCTIWFVHWPCSRLLLTHCSHSKGLNKNSVVQLVGKALFNNKNTKLTKWELSGSSLMSLAEKFFNSKSRGINSLIEIGKTGRLSDPTTSVENSDGSHFNSPSLLPEEEEESIVNSTVLHNQAIQIESATSFGNNKLPILETVTFVQDTNHPDDQLIFTFKGPHILDGIRASLEQNLMNYPIPPPISSLITGDTTVIPIDTEFVIQ